MMNDKIGINNCFYGTRQLYVFSTAACSVFFAFKHTDKKPIVKPAKDPHKLNCDK